MNIYLSNNCVTRGHVRVHGLIYLLQSVLAFEMFTRGKNER